MTVVFDKTSILTGTDDGGGDDSQNIRIFLPSATLSSAPGATQFRLTLRFGTGNGGGTLVPIWAGYASGSGVNTFDGNQVQVLWGGSATLTIPATAGYEVTSDWITLGGGATWDNTKNFLVAYFAPATDTALSYSNASLTNAITFYAAGATSEASQTTPSAMNQLNNNLVLVEKIEVQSAGVALPGVGAVSSAGTFPFATSLAGAAASGTAGSFAKAIIHPFSGAAALGAAAGVNEEEIILPSLSTAMVGSAGNFSFGNNLSLGLTGASAAGAAGSPTKAIVDLLVGAAAFGAAGSFVEAIAELIAGAAGSGTAGTFIDAIVDFLVGAPAGAGAGNFSFGNNVTQALPGAGASGAAGSFIETVLLALASVSGAGTAGSFGASETEILIGASVSGSGGNFLDAVLLALVGAAGAGSAGSLQPFNGVLVGAGASSGAGLFSVSRSGGIGNTDWIIWARRRGRR